MYFFIVNYGGGSGRGRRVWRDVRGILQAEAVPYRAFRTKYPGHATRLTIEILRRYGSPQAPVSLVVVGGDGTINEVLNGITDFEKVWLGVIPTGSGNDFVRGHGLLRKTVPALMSILNCEIPERVDVGVAAGDSNAPKLFGISAGIGLDAEVCKKAMESKQKKMLNGVGLRKLTYLLLTIESLFTMKTVDGRVIFDGDFGNVLRLKKLIYLAAMNTPWEGGGVPMSPTADPTDGQISICAAAGVPKWKSFFELPVLVAGKQKKLKDFTLRNARTIDIEMEHPVVLHLDGEYGGDVRRIHIDTLPGKLQLMKGNGCRSCSQSRPRCSC